MDNNERIQQITEDYFNLSFSNTKFGIITTRLKIKEVNIKVKEDNTIELIKTNNIFNVSTEEIYGYNLNSKLYKRYCQIIVADNIAYIKNLQPNRYCCDSLKKSFSICSQHGLLCPDYYIRYDSRDYFIRAINATYRIDYCPYCGEYLYKNYEQEIGY